jgi:alpha-beta hydrolase superfamily lysophospholipase
MKTSLNRIITSDGLELSGLLYEPDSATTKVLVHVHGMAGNFYENVFLDTLAETLTANGVAFFAFNNRGCEYIKDMTRIVDGKRVSVRIGDAYELFDDSELDIRAAVDFAHSKGLTEVHLSGHSLGGPKVAYYAAEGNDDRLASVIFLSPADMVGLTKADKNYQRDMSTATKMISEGRGGELLPFPILWDQIPLTAQTYVSLNDEKSKVAIFNLYDPNDTLAVLGKITIPSTTITGRKDDATTIPLDQAMDRIKNAMVQSPRVETVVLGDADHGYNGHEQALADAVQKWIATYK